MSFVLGRGEFAATGFGAGTLTTAVLRKGAGCGAGLETIRFVMLDVVPAVRIVEVLELLATILLVDVVETVASVNDSLGDSTRTDINCGFRLAHDSA